MKKLLYLLLILPLFVACGSDDDDDFNYDSVQKEFLVKLEGTWSRTTGIQSDKTEYIKFSKYYSSPNVDIKDFIAMGECIIQEYDITSDKYINYNAYYWVTNDASVLRFYDRDTNKQLDAFLPLFENNNKLILKYKDSNHLGISTKIYFRQ